MNIKEETELLLETRVLDKEELLFILEDYFTKIGKSIKTLAGVINLQSDNKEYLVGIKLEFEKKKIVANQNEE